MVYDMNLMKQHRHESKKLRDSARGQECMVRIPGVCNHNPETTVLAHLNGGGMGTKTSDLFGAFCCSDCHSEIDSRTMKIKDRDYVKLCHIEGVVGTLQYWLDNDFIKFP